MTLHLKDLELTTLHIPFRTAFKHASAQRAKTESVIAIAHSDGPEKGYGEGCPRSYVTGESIESCQRFLAAHLDSIKTIESFETLKNWAANHTDNIDRNPAAWCALEMSILDLLGKIANQSVESILGITELDHTFSYTAVLGASSSEAFDTQLKRYAALEFEDYKVKVSGTLFTDQQNLARIIERIPASRIRLDANNLWSNVYDAIRYLSALGATFWAIEEPLPAGRYSELQGIATELGCKIILDESFLRCSDLAILEDDPSLWIPNIRISKMGGILRSLTVAERCRDIGLKFILGAQVGETSLLTRAALLVAAVYHDSLLAQEGAFGTYLLTHDITTEPLMFGSKGVLHFKGNKNGLGINVTI